MSHVAYALTAAAEKARMTPGVLAYGAGQALNVPQALKDGKGTFVVPEYEQSLVVHLDEFVKQSVLKRVSVPDKDPHIVDTTEGLDKEALEAKAIALGVPVDSGATKDDMRTAIRNR